MPLTREQRQASRNNVIKWPLRQCTPADIFRRDVRPEEGTGHDVIVNSNSCVHSTIDELIAAGVEMELADVVAIGKQQRWLTR